MLIQLPAFLRLERLHRAHALRVAAAWCAGWLVATAPGTAQAQDLATLSSQWLEGALAQSEAQSLDLRMEVQVGRLDARLKLAPCEEIEPYMPSGSKLWGRTRVGLRCVKGEKLWNVFLPVTVKAYGPAWVLTGNVSAGQVLDASHAMQSEVDWAESPHNVLAAPEAWQGQTAARNLTAGMTLRESMVRPPVLFKVGAVVKVLVQGGGFVVTSSGKALEAAGEGQSVRVKMDNGRTVMGTVNAQGEVIVAQ